MFVALVLLLLPDLLPPLILLDTEKFTLVSRPSEKGLFFHISRADWQILIIAIILVWAAEILNSAFEYLCDVVTAEFHPAIEKAKDIAAAAVLVTAAGAAILGVTVFWPYISR